MGKRRDTSPKRAALEVRLTPDEPASVRRRRWAEKGDDDGDDGPVPISTALRGREKPSSKASGITDIQGVKGKTIATYGIGAPPQVAFQVTLAKAGIDPQTDVTWKAVPFDLVGESVNRGDADLAAHLDPWAYSIEKQFNFTKIADTQTGVYENHTCCVLGANGPFLAANKDALRRLAEESPDQRPESATVMTIASSRMKASRDTVLRGSQWLPDRI